MTRDHRRLAAIVSADVAGYSRLMGRDDSGTLAILKAHRRELLDPKIAEYGGRIVKTTGDGLLLEFPSVVDAVRCAVDVQRGMAERNAGVPPDQRIDFRIGINVGDIIIDGDDIFGDGVNVAARLEALAEPGGICASRVVRDQVLDKLSFGFEDLGAQQVKNIARPVEVFRIDLGSGTSPAQDRGHPLWRRLTQAHAWRWLAAGVVVIALAGVAFWMLPPFHKSVVMTAPALSVAVLPFAAAGAGAAEELFASSFTKDFTSAVANGIHAARVVSYNLAATYKGKSIDARSVGRELNVRYLVEGDVKQVGERVTVNLQLVDTDHSTQVWSDRVEVDPARTAQDLAALLPRLIVRVRAALSNAELRRAAGPPAPGASAMDIALHAEAVWSRDDNTTRGALEARKIYDQALRLDPSLMPALLGRWLTLEYELDLDPHADHDRLVHEMDEMSFRAVSIDAGDPVAWMNRAETLMRQWRWDAALEANAKTEKLDLTPGWALNQRAEMMIHVGRPVDALALVQRELALDPEEASEVGAAMLQRCRANLLLGRYEEAIVSCQKDVALNNWWRPHVYLVAAYAQKGDSGSAATEKAALLKMRQGFSIGDYKTLRLSNDPVFQQQAEAQLFAGLRKAGIPE